MINLSEDLLIGSGQERDCYLHPSNLSRCIKISVRPPKKIRRAQQPRDKYYYQYLLKRDISWLHLAKFYGSIETNLGEGLVFEVPRDSNGSISNSLQHYIEKSLISQEELELHLTKLREYIYKEAILVCDLAPENILLNIKEEKKLIIIDGIGRRNFLKTSAHIKTLARTRLDNHWKRLLFRISELNVKA